MSQTAAVRGAVVARLLATPAVAGVVTGIYNGLVPDGVQAVEPYVVVGESTEADIRFCGPERGDDSTLAVRVWDRMRTDGAWLGYTRAERIAGSVERALTVIPLAVAGRTPVHVRRLLSTTVPQPDPLRAMALVRVRLRSMEVAA